MQEMIRNCPRRVVPLCIHHHTKEEKKREDTERVWHTVGLNMKTHTHK